MAVIRASQSNIQSPVRYNNMGTVARSWGAGSGGTEVTTGGYKYHTFTTVGDNSFTVTTPGKFEYLLVAGGGGGGSGSQAGGGAGGLLNGFVELPAGAVNIRVGNKGENGFGRPVFTSNSTSQGHNGGHTFLGDSIIAINGGGAARGDGGSGGGSNLKGIVGQGNDGGTYGGGGAGQAGDVRGSGSGGHGLAFNDWAIATSTGELNAGDYYYAGGGEGQSSNSGGGYGGGGERGNPGTAGVANTGGGGGSGNGGAENFIASGGDGGTGIAIVRYAV